MQFDINTLTHYAPVIVIIVGFLIQQRLVVTPEQLEKKHREILKTLDDNKLKCENHCVLSYVTKAEMQIERKNLLETVDNKYLERKVYEEAQKRVDEKFADIRRQYEKITENQEYIKDLIIKHFVN